MATSNLTVWNMSLGFLKNTSSVTDENENSLEAKYCRIYFDTCVGAVLRDHLWTFAKKHETLALTGTSPTGWEYSYKYPADCVKLDRIYNPVDPQDILLDRIPFEVAANPSGVGKLIWTDENLAELIYGIDQRNPELWTFDFIEALAYKLGGMLGFSIANNRQRASDMNAQYYATLNRAQTNNVREGTKNVDRASGWTEDRA